MSGGKSGKTTTGYKYFMDLHFGICHGPVDALVEIRVGDRTAYDVEVTGSTTIYINEPKLFGGKSREGGIQGYADVLGGTPTQGVNAYLQEQLGADARLPAFRGLFALVYKGGQVSSNNPYIKEWAFKVRRIIEGWGEYGSETVSELTSDALYPWVEGGADPRDPRNGHEYKHGGNAWTDFGTAKSQLETTLLADIGTHHGWSKGTIGNAIGSTQVSPHVSGVTADDYESVALHFNNYSPSGGYFPSLTEHPYQSTVGYAQSGFEKGAALYQQVGGSGPDIWWNGVTTPNASHATITHDGTNDGTPKRRLGVYRILPWATLGDRTREEFNDNLPDIPSPGNELYSSSTSMDSLLQVRRTVAAPEIPGSDLPDWPEDPTNYWWDEDTGDIYSKEPWSQVSGDYLWLAKYATSGSPVTVSRYPLGPVLHISDPQNTEAFWTAARSAAILAGYQVGGTYQADGLGGVDTFPIYVGHAWSRTYQAIVPNQPPDPGLAKIDDDMNPAHIVRQCITNTEWGMGYPDASIDDASFTAAAQTLYDEGFGLSFQWVQSQPIEDFIGEVLNHCGGVWYADPRTGLFSMALIRDDYSVSDLRVFDETNIIRLESYQKPGYGELVNQIVVAWTDVANNKTATTPPLQDPACIQAQGAVIGEVRQYPGITKSELAQRVALRDLTAASTPLASLKIKVNRYGWDLIPGKDVIVVNWDKLGIVQLVCRVLKVDRGTLDDGTITLEVAEDVFGLPSAVYTTQEEEGWTPPETGPEDITVQDLVESPYWDLARNLSAADLDYTDVDAGYVFTLAARSNSAETEYRIWSKTGGTDADSEYEERNVVPWAPTALLNGAIDQQDTTINIDNGVDLSLVTLGSRVLIGSGAMAEFCEVLTLNTTTGVMTVERGVLDTTPQSHSDNTRVWFVDDALGVDPTERALSDEVDVKLTSIAPAGETEVEDATEQSIVMAGRFGRPYPPGRLTVNGQFFPTTVDTTEQASEGFVIEWAHRDRTQQDVELVPQTETSIGPEPGTTYTVELYNDVTDVLIDGASGITGTSLSLTATDSYQARLEVYSVRDGRESWQRQVRRFFLIGTNVFVTEDGDYFITEDGELLAPE